MNTRELTGRQLCRLGFIAIMHQSGMVKQLPHSDSVGLEESTFWSNYTEFELFVLTSATQMAHHARRSHSNWSDVLIILHLTYGLQLEHLLPDARKLDTVQRFIQHTLHDAKVKLHTRDRHFQEAVLSELHKSREVERPSFLPKSSLSWEIPVNSINTDPKRHEERMQFLVQPRCDTLQNDPTMTTFRRLMLLTGSTMRPFQPSSKSIKDRLLRWQRQETMLAISASPPVQASDLVSAEKMQLDTTSSKVNTVTLVSDTKSLTAEQQARLWYELWQQDSNESVDEWQDVFTSKLPLITDPSGSDFTDNTTSVTNNVIASTPIDGTRKRGRKKQDPKVTIAEQNTHEPVSIGPDCSNKDGNNITLFPQQMTRPVYVHLHFSPQLRIQENPRERCVKRVKCSKGRSSKVTKGDAKLIETCVNEYGNTNLSGNANLSDDRNDLLSSPSQTRLCVNEAMLAIRAITQLRSIRQRWQEMQHDTTTSSKDSQCLTATSLRWPQPPPMSLPPTLSSESPHANFQERWENARRVEHVEQAGLSLSSLSNSTTRMSHTSPDLPTHARRNTSRSRVSLFTSSIPKSAMSSTSATTAATATSAIARTSVPLQIRSVKLSEQEVVSPSNTSTKKRGTSHHHKQQVLSSPMQLSQPQPKPIEVSVSASMRQKVRLFK